MSTALHNLPGTCSFCSPLRNSNEVEKFSKKLRICRMYPRDQPKALRVRYEQKSYLPIYQGGWPLPFLAHDLRPKLNLVDSCAINSRYFCKVPGAVVHEKNSLGLEDGGYRSKSFFRRFRKQWKGGKVVSAQKRISSATEGQGKNNSTSSISATEKSMLVNSGDQLLRDDNKDLSNEFSGSSTTNNLQKIKAKRKRKQQSGSTKFKEKSSGINTVSEEATHLTGSQTASQTRKTRLPKNKESPDMSEISSDANKLAEALESNASTKHQSKAKARKSKMKGKSNVEAIPILKLNEEKIGLSNSRQELESHTKGKTKVQGETKLGKLYPPTAKSVMVVESAAKANVIQGYLGDMFEVIPSYGHVRDLAARSGSVRPDEDFSMVWEVPSAAWTHLKCIQVALTGAKNLVLASDPDREGEAIAWHIIEMLQQQGAIHENINVARVVFNEITESSIKRALHAPRAIDVNLVHAYLARRALDYLIGFNISPLLWRKLPGCQSAGRVQSAALSLICDREKEIDQFRPQEYWSVEVKFSKKDLNSSKEHPFASKLTHFNNMKVDQLSIGTHEEARNIESKIKSSIFEVVTSNKSKGQINPPSPYRTSTLQQDAANKFHFPTAYTMKLAQKLYEGVQLLDDQATGLITYMRTDGLNISDDAANDIQSFVRERYGHNFASKTTRKYFNKVKNAQEAHEAIRPTNIRRLPSTLAQVLDEDCLKLYTLIWSRTVACQMEPATVHRIQLDVATADNSIIFRSSSSKVDFLGYQSVFKDIESNALGSEETEVDNSPDVFEVLGALRAGDVLNLCKIELDQHFTLPPARYNEGSLVKKLEELGIGRPSTYASTIKVLKDRNYVAAKSRVLYPEFRGRMVSAYLSHYFSEVTDYSFTADMETELDNVSAGLTEWKGLLSDYWTRFSNYCEKAGAVHIHQVEKMLEKTFGDFLFATLPDRCRTCPSCLEGTLNFKVSRFGAGYFIGCDQHPRCKYIAKTIYKEEEEDISLENKTRNVEPPKLLGLHPGSSEQVLLKKGPYGDYVQLGQDRSGYSPKRASVSQIKDVSTITLEDALDLLRYPVTLGKHPVDGSPVMVMNKNGGFSIKHRRTRAPVPKNTKPSDVTLEVALKLLQGKAATRSGRPKAQPELEE